MIIKPLNPVKFEQADSVGDEDFLLLGGLNKPWRRLLKSVLAEEVAPEAVKGKQERWDSGTIYSYETTVDSISVAVTADQVPCVLHVLWRGQCEMTVNASSNGLVTYRLYRESNIEDLCFPRLNLSSVGASVSITLPLTLMYQFPTTVAGTSNFYVKAFHNGNCSSANSGQQRFEILVIPRATML